MDTDLLKLTGAVAGIVFTAIFGIVCNKLFNLPTTFQERFGEFEAKFADRLTRMDEETKLSHRRLNVHDRISSKIIRQDFDSRSIAENGIYPSVKDG